MPQPPKYKDKKRPQNLALRVCPDAGRSGRKRGPL